MNKLKASEVLSNFFVEIESEDELASDELDLVEEREDTDEEELNHDVNVEDEEIVFNASDRIEDADHDDDEENEIILGTSTQNQIKYYKLTL
jgi:hypothetical protein